MRDDARSGERDVNGRESRRQETSADVCVAPVAVPLSLPHGVDDQPDFGEVWTYAGERRACRVCEAVKLARELSETGNGPAMAREVLPAS